ncbi:CHAP domain-containing protein [Ruminococcus sp.]|uniref:CHAP domain-containing protein n=1 Tax=Ruminococcus sp. TaxID=41978 RepID=UPI003FD758EC
MADIKTRDMVKGSIKTIDKSAVAAQRMKYAFIQTKEKAEHAIHTQESSAEEYASNRMESGIDRVSHEAVHQFDKQGRKGFEATKQNVSKAKDGIRTFKEKRAAQSLEKQGIRTTRNKGVKVAEQTQKTVKQSARSTGKKTIKTVGKGSAKTAQKTVKTAERTAKTTVKTAQRTAKAAQKTAQATVKTAQRAAQAARAAAKAAVVTVKAIAKATALAIKAIIAGTKALIATIAAGGWVAVLVIIVICLIGMILGSVFGIFFSDEDSGTGMSMQTVVQEINTEYDTKLQEEKNSVSYDVLEMSGSRAVWKEVLAVYSVKTNTDQDNPQEVATMDDGKKQLLKDIFWEMNQISSRTESKTETVITETDDGHGNIVETESTVTQTYLYITVSHKTAEEMAAQYGFNEEQKGYLAELLADENNYLWSQVLYGITGGDGQIVTVALSLVGNVGGQPYWSWYGFNSRVEWCACFVSWCANECGYIDAGVIPKYAGCVNGVQWFKDRGQWLDGSAEPAPGMIIFFDWADESGQDGLSDHTGIVQKVENGKVYTVEGNSGDSCRVNEYSIGYYEILGYGAPAY